MRNHENVGKQNCRIESKSADRLQRCFGRKLWVEPKLEKISRLLRFPADNGRLAASAKPVATYMVACTRSVWDLPPHQPGRRCA
jgi:hypothetical protein